MIELTFLTSSLTKLAHIRYLVRHSGISVRSFHERTFRANYSEPRSLNRHELLEASYDSALSQWKKAGFSEDRFFFLEDTSVEIKALSSNHEFPGTEIKYWMRQMTFAKLDEQLRQLGGDRSAKVRSDIVLHLPAGVRKSRGIANRFLQFTGITEGCIAQQEPFISGSLIHPWRDRKSFNRWFIPAGQEQVISNIPTEAGKAFDFRRKSFDAMRAFFVSLGFNLNTVKNLQIQHGLPHVSALSPTFVVCGPSCSGKTTLASYLVQNFGYMHYEASDFMRVAFHERLGVRTAESVRFFAREALEEEPWIVPEKVALEIERLAELPVIVTGFRSPREVEVFRRELHSRRAEVLVLYVDCAVEIRFERAQLRRRSDAPASLDEMRSRDAEQNALGLSEIKSLDSIVTLQNSRDLESYWREFHEASQWSGSIEKIAESAIRQISPLERAVITCLDGEQGSEGRSSAEIATMLSKSHGRVTHKDNVSRFLNQRVHPYFSISLDRGRAKYSLSATGSALLQRMKKVQGESVKRTV